MELEAFENLARGRRATRHFRSDPLPEGMVERLLEAARWAPSGYNLQPVHFTVVRDAGVKEALYAACLKQAQVREAPATVVFTGDRRVVQNNFEKTLACEKAARSLDEKYEAILRRIVPLAFGHGPCGIGWLWKAVLPPFARFLFPIPALPAVAKRIWLAKQASLAAMTFMHAAHAAGLATVPMEGFDERRLRRALNLPSSQVPILVVPVGHAAGPELKKTRLPLETFLHRDRWND